MIGTARDLLIAIALAVLVVSNGYGQPAGPASAPAALPHPAPCSCEPSNTLPQLMLAPPGIAGPPACAPYEDDNGPLLKGSPFLDWPACAPPGCFGAIELDLVGPHIKNRLTGSVTVNGATDQVHLPT